MPSQLRVLKYLSNLAYAQSRKLARYTYESEERVKDLGCGVADAEQGKNGRGSLWDVLHNHSIHINARMILDMAMSVAGLPQSIHYCFQIFTWTACPLRMFTWCKSIQYQRFNFHVLPR